MAASITRLLMGIQYQLKNLGNSKHAPFGAHNLGIQSGKDQRSFNSKRVLSSNSFACIRCSGISTWGKAVNDKTKTERMRRYRAKLKGDGFVNVTVKVPADKRESIIRQAAKLRGE